MYQGQRKTVNSCIAPTTLSRQEFADDLLELIFASARHPENMNAESIRDVYRYAFARRDGADARRIEREFRDIIQNTNDQVVSVLCWQLFVTGASKADIGHA